MHRLPLLLTLVCLAAAGALAQVPQADPRAVQIMRDVHTRRYTWDAAFPGFEGKLLALHRDKEHRGTARVDRDLKVEVELPDPLAAKWATETLQSMAQHRRHVAFEAGDGRYPLTLGEADDHPAGRIVRLNDETRSTYRVRDAQILQINRTAGPRTRFTIDILESTKADDGRFLPRSFTVAYFQAPSGDLLKTETFTDTYSRVGAYWLPETRRQVTAEASGTTASLLRIDSHKLLPR